MSNPLASCLAVIIAVVVCVQPVLGAGSPALRETEWIEAGRDVIAAQLMAVGRGPEEARVAAHALTIDDLVVLIANPSMMQPAGQTMSRSLLLGLLLIAVLIVIGSSSNGFVSISS